VLLLTLARRLLLQILHVLVVVLDVVRVLVCSNTLLAAASEIAVPFALAPLLLPEVLLLVLLDFLGAAVGVFFEEQTGLGAERPDSLTG